MKHLPKQIRADVGHKHYTDRENLLAQHLKIPAQPHKGVKKGYITDVRARTFRDSIKETTGAY
jgi:hypothetical protein